jgi:hypothetical protein
MKRIIVALVCAACWSTPCYSSDIEARLSEIERKLDIITHPCGVWTQQHTAFLIARTATTTEQRQKLIEVQAARKAGCANK